MNKINCTETHDQSIVPFSIFLKQVGRSATCGWRWRQKGWIKTVNVAGRIYITQQEIERFHARAAAGEFAQRSGPVFVYDDPMVASIKSRSMAEVPKEPEHADE